MQQQRFARSRRLTVIATSAALAVLNVGAPPAAAANSTDTTAKVVLATTDEIRAMAAADGNEVITFSAKPTSRAGTQYTITCYPRFTMPYGPDTAGSSVTVDAFVYCDDWVHSISLRPQIYRSNSLVASALYTVAYVNFVAGSVSTPCLPGSYFSAITAVMARYDAYPPVIQVSLRLPDTSFTCAGAPPPPPPPAGVTVTNPGDQVNYAWDSVSLQMRASGGTGTYTWTATGLPSGLVLDTSTGLITGNVRTVATSAVTITATSGGQTASTSFTWYVQSEPCPHC